MSFLKAEWRKLIMANYVVDPDVLDLYLPARTELDFFGDRCYVSLVGFLFEKSRLFGIPVPFHQQFEEVNLRFYVRHKYKGEWRRGAVFISEFVPKTMVALIANNVYGEHYSVSRMGHTLEVRGGQQKVGYHWRHEHRWHNMSVNASVEPFNLVAGSEEEFITEHYWGYTRYSAGRTAEYEVRHPRWQCYQINEHDIDVDFGLLYGPEFAFLNETVPASILLAEGSPISVEKKRVNI